MPDEILHLASVRRVASLAGALRFNKAVGQIIGSDTAKDPDIDRAATLQRLLSLYNRMRAAKLYGQDEQFKRASAEMADAVDNYSKRSPGGADRLRDVIQKLTFTDETNRRKAALEKKNR